MIMAESEFTKLIDSDEAQIAVASTVIPYAEDDNRAVYLSYRACGLSIDEALAYAGVTKSALHKWRAEDTEFKAVEVRLPEIRDRLATQRLNIEFLRNLTFLFRRDSHIIQKALLVDNWTNTLMRQVADGEITAKEAKDKSISLTKQVQQYLLKIRSQYTPEQFELLRSLLGDKNKEKFDWAALAAQMQKARGKIKMTRTDTVEIEEGSSGPETQNHIEG